MPRRGWEACMPWSSHVWWASQLCVRAGPAPGGHVCASPLYSSTKLCLSFTCLGEIKLWALANVYKYFWKNGNILVIMFFVVTCGSFLLMYKFPFQSLLWIKGYLEMLKNFFPCGKVSSLSMHYWFLIALWLGDVVCMITDLENPLRVVLWLSTYKGFQHVCENNVKSHRCSTSTALNTLWDLLTNDGFISLSCIFVEFYLHMVEAILINIWDIDLL